MPNEVFANGMELACKAGEGKSICAFPDVCFTPPENPATPPGVPTPYPNTGMASDTTDGSKTVQISSREVMLKNKSYFKTSAGDEAGCAAKKGAVTSVNRGKVYFSAWSMDVKFEGHIPPTLQPGPFSIPPLSMDQGTALTWQATSINTAQPRLHRPNPALSGASNPWPPCAIIPIAVKQCDALFLRIPQTIVALMRTRNSPLPTI
jgi:hypothetical protein